MDELELLEAVDVGRLSFSRLQMWLKCQRQYYYRYVCGVVLPPRAAMAFGAAVHRGLAEGYREMARRARVPPLDILTETFADVWDSFRDEAEFGPDEDPDRMKDEGVEVLSAHHAAVMPQLLPADESWVERPVEGVIGGVAVAGVVDLATENTVVDHKVVRKAQPVGRDVQLQLWTYRELTARHYPFLAVSRLVVGRNPRAELIPVEPPGPREVLWFENVVRQVQSGIKAALETGLWLPAPMGAWWCSPEWCGYWDRCHEDWG